MNGLPIPHGRVDRVFAGLILVAVCSVSAAANPGVTADNPYTRVLREYRLDLSALPTDRWTAPLSRLPALDAVPPGVVWRETDDGAGDGDIPPEVMARLRKPFISLAAEWEPESSGFEIASYDLAVKMATPPLFGPPPPFLKGDFSLTQLVAPAAVDLPDELYDVSLGFDWMRHLSDCWMLRLAFASAYASDGENNSRNAWQFRGAVLGIRQWGETWQLVVGAVASGRRDFPVFPGVGAIWKPSPAFRLDLVFPQPRASWRVFDNGSRQQWLYFGGGISGGTWAYQQSGGLEDVLTYNEWRALVGWEWVPTPRPGALLTVGHKLAVELGYGFAREFEFDRPRPALQLDDTLLLRTTWRF